MQMKVLKRVLNEEARQKGIQEGIQEDNIATARRLLAAGMDAETVIEMTELDEEQVFKIQQEISE